MAVSRRLRFEVLKRDDYTCRYCGANPKNTPDIAMEIDHVVAVALGGGDDPTNLVTACQPCNAGKSSVPADAALVDDVAADALRWARAIEMAAELREVEQSTMDGAVDAIWEVFGSAFCPVDWEDTVRRFLRRGVSPEEMVRLGRMALGRRNVSSSQVWRYFCGCCWNVVSDLEEAARQIVEDGVVSGQD